VKQVAAALTAQDGANHYGQVYEALYRQFGVSSYKNVARAQYDEVLAWLRRWYDDATRSIEP
jgi:hypothetical protein